MTGERYDPGRDFGDRCDEECSGRKSSSTWITFWIIILTLVAIGIIFSMMMRFMGDFMPHWMHTGDFWDIFGLLIPLAFVIFIIYILTEIKKKD